MIDFYWTEHKIEQLVKDFQQHILPIEEWTHHTHLAVGMWHIKQYKIEETICWLRSGIISYNRAAGGENTPTKGYHETLTLFWIKVLYHYANLNPKLPIDQLCHHFFNDQLSNKDLPFQYYSKEFLLSTTARAKWQEPDLKTLNF